MDLIRSHNTGKKTDFSTRVLGRNDILLSSRAKQRGVERSCRLASRYRSLKFFLIAIGITLAFAVPAKADFNVPAGTGSGTGIKDWSAPSATGAGPVNITTTGTTNAEICKQMFSFQSDNVLQGTFCDLANIGAVSVADFATNVTCTIQNVAMPNYDSKITFAPPASTGASTASLCTATNAGGEPLNVSGTNDVFGKGDLIQDTTGGTVGHGNGIYDSNNRSELTDLIIPKTNAPSSWAYKGYTIVRDVAVVLALILLLIFAFANIIHLDVNTYTVKKLVPNLVVALIGSYLVIFVIFLISRGIDFLYRFEVFSPYNALHPFYNIMNGAGNLGLTASTYTSSDSAIKIVFSIGSSVLSTGAGQQSLLSAGLGMIFLAIPAVIVFAFEYVMALRPIAIGILTVISPIAFACYIMPQTQHLFKKWWTITLIALFYAPLVNFVFYVLNLISGSTTGGLIFMLSILIKSAVIVMLIRLPFTIETDFKKLSLALQKSSLAANLGLSKGAAGELKVKQQSKSENVTDKILQTKAAQSIIAPVNKNFNRDVTASKAQSRQFASSFAQIINRTKQTTVRDLDTITESAHKANKSRPANILVSSISDLKPQTFRKILSSSDQSVFKQQNIVNELKLKNGQILDDQGAAIRADAARKVVRLAQVVEQNRPQNPDAIRSLAQKGMLDVLPVEVLQLSLQQGIIGPNDIKSNFQNPDAAYEKIANYRRNSVMNNAQVQEAIDQDHQDAQSGYTDINTVISENASRRLNSVNSGNINEATNKTIEQLRTQNQTYFDKNATYYIERLKETNNSSKVTIAKTLQGAGTPAQTAIALAQNPTLPFDQMKKYLPQNTSSEVLSVIKQNVDTRDISGGAMTQIAKALKEDKVILGKTVAEKVSESFKSGTSKNFDDVKRTLTESVKTLSSNPTPENAKQAMANINTFAPGSAIATATGAPSIDEMDKAKDKGQEVISTIEEMKTGGIKEQTIAQNPAQAAKEFEDHVSSQVSQVLSGATKDGKSFEQQLGSVATKKDGGAASSAIQESVANQVGKVLSGATKDGKTFEQQIGEVTPKIDKASPNKVPDADNTKDESMKTIDQIDADQTQATSTLSTKSNDGKNFDQQIGDISSSTSAKKV